MSDSTLFNSALIVLIKSCLFCNLKLIVTRLPIEDFLFALVLLKMELISLISSLIRFFLFSSSFFGFLFED